ncbi:helix-turn-helix transcriptional regulator [Photorhabdus laumondii]|uniref:DNA-directed RNA polymerase specialized sigma subunit n=1 Tax=Photorhabdus aegyptia TaxID=2805098 RepID=A0A022PIY5_9GAMM|nr:helix-turn-helix transcriptional regulator [Photorhabdus aegyptia]EYU15464.1 DNA-directed RNA polymerase specialized sigma subunit [Photorhabdus aegyptia]
MSIKGVPYSDVKAELLADPEVHTLYMAEKKEEELKELLLNMRNQAELNSTQVAERMGITQPAVSKLERNAGKASILTLERYAVACGASLSISFQSN